MTLEFKNKEIQDEYFDLLAQEDDLLSDLEPIQARIREIESKEERE